MIYDFVCLRCSGRNLGYEKWVSCKEPVTIHPDEHIEYGPPKVDDTDALGSEAAFFCQDCGEKPLFWGSELYSEHDLCRYLSMTFEKRKDMEQSYLDQLAEQGEIEEARQCSEADCFVEHEDIFAQDVQK